MALLAAFVCTATFGWAQSRSSIDSDVRLGKTLAREFESRVTLDADPDTARLVDRVGQFLTRNSKASVPLVFKVVDSRDINVFTFVGSVYITRGLLAAASSEAEFAFALAHGVALHDPRTWASAFGFANRRSLFPARETSSSVVLSNAPSSLTPNQISQLSAQREEVLAADKIAIQILYNAGYATSASTRFLQTVEARSSASKPETSMMHPKLSDRIKKSQEWTQTTSRSRDTEVITTVQYDEVHRRVCQCSK
jgi:predicted Zn-dependent protease